MLVGLSNNEYGTATSVHTCDSCGGTFTVCPAVGNKGWESCLAEDCPSYDPKRDADKLFDNEPEKIRRCSKETQ